MASESTRRKQDWIKRNPEKQKAIQLRHREKYKERTRDRQYKRKYGISIEEYDNLLQEQQGVCRICGLPENTKRVRSNEIMRLAIDHSHITGEVRGLLCHSCNTGLGKFKEDISLLQKAILYLG